MKSFLILNKTKISGTVAIAVTSKGKRIKVSTGIECHPSKFKNGQPIRTQTLIRERINAVQKQVDEYLLTTDEVTPMGIKQVVAIATGKAKKENLNGLIATYIKHKQKEVSANTMKKINPQLKHFQSFKPRKELKDINSKFWESYINSITREGLEPQSTNTYIKNIKAFFNWLVKHEHAPISITNGLNFLQVKDNHIIAINQNELEQLQQSTDANGNAIKLDGRLERVKDLFLFSCYTGLRFSDLEQVSNDLINDGIMTIKQTKTGNIVQIPMLTDATAILKKYGYQLPVISNQKTNKYIKELFALLGLNRKVYHRNGLLPLDEVITFHVSRKSFVTIALTRGMHAKVVQAISGHKEDSIFNKYIAFANESLKSEMQKMERGKVVQMQVAN